MKYSKKVSDSAWSKKNWLEPADGLKKKKKSPTGRDASRILPSTTSKQTPRLPKLCWLISKYYKPK